MYKKYHPGLTPQFWEMAYKAVFIQAIQPTKRTKDFQDIILDIASKNRCRNFRRT
jgi:hypothetical protein